MEARSEALLAAADVIATMGDAYQVVGPRLIEGGIDEGSRLAEEAARLALKAEQLRQEAQEAEAEAHALPSLTARPTPATETPSVAGPGLVAPGTALSTTTEAPTRAPSLSGQDMSRRRIIWEVKPFL